MCSYKAVKVSFEVWGLQGKVESGVHRVSTDCCLVVIGSKLVNIILYMFSHNYKLLCSHLAGYFRYNNAGTQAGLCMDG